MAGAAVGYFVGKATEKKEKSSVLVDSDTSSLRLLRFPKGGIQPPKAAPFGKGDRETCGLIERQKREKEAHKASILELFKTTTPLTNNHIEQMLGISDATATRYLEELEKEGKVRQVGKTGRGVSG